MPKQETGDQKISQICLSSTVWKVKYSLYIVSEIILRWLTYCDGLLNTENTRKQIEHGLLTEVPIEILNESEVCEQLGNMGVDI